MPLRQAASLLRSRPCRRQSEVKCSAKGSCQGRQSSPQPPGRAAPGSQPALPAGLSMTGSSSRARLSLPPPNEELDL